jgi:sec-independent protein translocase protein TatB
MSIPILGIGVAEALVILVLTLLLVGPKRFPEIMRQVGHWYRIARGFTTEVMKDVRAAVDEIEEEINTETEDLQSVRDLADVRNEVEQDLQKAKLDARQAERETERAARSATDSGAAANGAGSSTRRPSRRTGPKPSNTRRPSTRPQEPEVAPESDPFKALEARQAAAARESQQRGESESETDRA